MLYASAINRECRYRHDSKYRRMWHGYELCLLGFFHPSELISLVSHACIMKGSSLLQNIVECKAYSDTPGI
jgi:hypothetical protein